MSEASWEEKIQRDKEDYEHALHAKYHLINMGGNRYGIITLASFCATQGEEHTIYRFVKGMERLKFGAAARNVRALNKGLTTEDSYGAI